MPVPETLVEELSALTPTECLDLSSALEKKWGVSATISSAPHPTIQPSTPVVEAQTEFSVVLTGLISTTNKISVIKAVREATKLGLAEAKAFVEALGVVKEGLSYDDAQVLAGALIIAGAVVEVK